MDKKDIEDKKAREVPIMEAASKNRRGRPKVHPSIADAPPGLFTAHSDRGRNNYMFAIEALEIIGCQAKGSSMPTPFPMLVDWAASNARSRGAVKFGVLTELGRAAREHHPNIVRLMAERINDALSDGRLKTARDAELQVREWRKMLRDQSAADEDDPPDLGNQSWRSADLFSALGVLANGAGGQPCGGGGFFGEGSSGILCHLIAPAVPAVCRLRVQLEIDRLPAGRLRSAIRRAQLSPAEVFIDHRQFGATLRISKAQTLLILLRLLRFGRSGKRLRGREIFAFSPEREPSKPSKPQIRGRARRGIRAGARAGP